MINKNIIFMGTPQIATVYLESLIKNKYNIVAVYTQPPKKKGRGMRIEKSPVHNLALAHNIKIFTPLNFSAEQEKNNLNRLRPELIIVMAYGLKLPNYLLNLPKLGCINIHVSLLPRWRGAAPIEYSLLNGDRETGVSIFKLVEKMDAGPIIEYESFEIDNYINKDELIEKLNILGVKLLHSILPNILNNKIKFKNQDHKSATYAPKISSNMRQLDFNQSIQTLHNKIRAFSLKPSAWFIYKDERIKIIEANFIKGKWKPSIILNNLFHISCKDGKMCPIIIQREGKKPMKLDDFLRGFAFEINSKVNV